MSAERYDAIIVGSGPNGLTAAATLATRGQRVLVLEAAPHIGGAASTSSRGRPGWSHDVGSTIHALAAASPAFLALGIQGEGAGAPVQYRHSPVLLAHPLDGGRGAAMVRSLDDTASSLGDDGKRYRRLIGPLAEGFDKLTDDILAPLLHWPRHPLLLARFALHAAPPMSLTARRFSSAQARALLGGSAAHAFTPFHHALSTSFALMLHALGHHSGWPFAEGGSGTITAALADIVTSAGGTIRASSPITTRRELPEHRALMLDTAPSAAAGILKDELPWLNARRFRRFRHGPGAFKVDYELSSPVPWTFEPARSAGTVHVVGAYNELAEAERSIARGRMPERPFVLACQASTVDPSRAPEGKSTLWTYAHVPAHFEGDVRPAIEAQLERFAPGFSDCVEASYVSSPRDLESANRNLIGGDVGGGSYTGLQLARRPRLSRYPYRTGVDGVYLCSASTPPGAGAHGMSGYNAALDVLSRELSADS